MTSAASDPKRRKMMAEAEGFVVQVDRIVAVTVPL